MNPSAQFSNIAYALVALAVFFGGFYVGDRSLTGSTRVVFRYVMILAGAAGAIWGLGRMVDDYERGVGFGKAFIAVCAAGAVFYEQHREGMKRPISERWKRFVGLTLAVAAIIAYFNAFRYGYPKYYHRWDQYHYYMGAKYFREMGYDGLYKCSVIAQDELGFVDEPDEDNPSRRMRLDMSREVRHPDKKIRNLGGDNLLMPVTEVLAHPEECKKSFAPARWDEYKRDVKFFRLASDKQYWEDMQKDHGYNPPPVWTVAGYILASVNPAGTKFMLPIIGKVIWAQILAMIDVGYLLGMFAALYWAFGWRVAAVGAVLWGCQASAPFYWTGGAFLRQDWIFYMVLAACLARKRWFMLAGASMVYGGLLRVFPGLTVIGWLAVAGFYVVKHKRMAPHHLKMLAGGVLAAAVLIPASLKIAGKDSYKEFYRHTLQVHDQTPLTNHMGLRVLVSQKLPFELPVAGIGQGERSGRMKYTKDTKLTDPFELWKRLRNERYAKVKWAAYGITALSLIFFLYVVRRIKSMWIAQGLAQIFIILMSQLTCYYYSFVILAAPLTKVRRNMEAPLFGFALLTQFVYGAFYWNDDKYWVLTFITLIGCFVMLCAFLPKDERARIAAMLGIKRGAPPAPQKSPSS